MSNEGMGPLITKEELENLVLPEELRDYLSSSERLKDKLYKNIIHDVSDLYLMYRSFYDFNRTEFAEIASTCIERANNLDKFYFYIKKMLETNLKISKKGNVNEKDNYVVIDQKKLDIVILETTKQYINLVDALYEQKMDINLIQVEKIFAKLELIQTLIPNDEYVNKLLCSGLKVYQKYLATVKENENEIKTSEEVVSKEE